MFDRLLTKQICLSWTIATLMSQTCFAEQKDIQKSPVTIPVGAFEFAPLLEIAESYSDNIFRRNTLQKDSLITQIHAGGQLSLNHKFNRYALTYLLQSFQYHNSPESDYRDHYVGLDTHTEFTSRHRLDVNAKYLDSHFMRGSFLNRDLLEPSFEQTVPDHYRLYAGDITYQYGRKNAKGNLEMAVSVNDVTFANNRERTLRQDRTEINATPAFYLRIMRHSRLLFQIENNWLYHKDSASTQFDYLKQRFLTGVTWSYSTQIQGTLRIGYLRQDYQDASITDYDGVTWDLAVHWSPLLYSRFDFSVSRDVRPSVNFANLRDSDRFRLDWSHDWSTRITSKMNAAYENASNSSTGRKDEYLSFGFDIRYGLQRWLGIGISYNFRQLQSSDPLFDFDQNVVMLYITGNPRISDEAKTPWASWY